MDQPVNMLAEQINNKKCYSCGKLFRTPANLAAHKNRKTPCLIREVTPEQRAHPNRCIFCNKIFAQPQTLTRHLKICKIKNGGMEILADKVKYEHENRILREQLEITNRRVQIMEDKMKQMELAILQPAKITNNTIYQAPVQINNITINNYMKPTIEGVKITADELSAANKLSKFLLRKFYFNPDIPQNHCLYLQNKKDRSLIIFSDNQWNFVMGENIADVINNLNNIVYANGAMLLSSENGPFSGQDAKFLELPGGDQEKIRQFNTGESQLSGDDAYEVFLGGRDVVLGTIRAAGCKLV